MTLISRRAPERISPVGVLAGGAAVAVLTVVLTVAATRGAAPPPPGLPDPGALTRWGLPVTRLVQDLAATASVGLLVLRVLALPPDLRDPVGLSAVERRALNWAGAAALVWAAAGALTFLLTFANLLGVPPTDPQVWTGLGEFAGTTFLGRILAESVVLTLLAAVGVLVARSSVLATVATFTALLAALLPAFAAHSAGSENHDAATVGMALHLSGVVLWVGGLVGLVVLRPVLGSALATTARNYSTLAGIAYALVGFSGVVNAYARVPDLGDASTSYLVVLAAKTLVFVGLGVAGWQQRRGPLRRLDADPASGSAFGRLVVVEVVLMSAAMGLAVALSQMSAGTR